MQAISEDVSTRCVLFPATVVDPDVDQESESGIQYYAGGCGTAEYSA